MCDQYFGKEHDILVPKAAPMIGWKVLSATGICTGPYRGAPLDRGEWCKANRCYCGRDSCRAGFHGFCFFRSPTLARLYHKYFFLSGDSVPVEKVEVRGRIKRARADSFTCWLAEEIRFAEVEVQS